jgi:hypothetical protein
MVEFATHRRERTGLYLDQVVAPANVDDETFERYFELVAGLGVLELECSVKRALVEGADVRIGR